MSTKPKPGAKVIKRTPAKPTSGGAKITPVKPGSAPAPRERDAAAKPAGAGAKITANARPARPGGPRDGSAKPSGRFGDARKSFSSDRPRPGARPAAKITPKANANHPAVRNAPILNRKKSPDTYRLFAICPGGLDDVLQKEVEQLPANVLATYAGGVEFEGDLEMAYYSTLKLRTASRLLLLIKDFNKIFKPEELYVAIQAIDWTKIFEPTSTLAIYLTESQTKDRRIPVNPQFWALKAKDAIVDQFQDKGIERPNVDRTDPDITVRLHLHDQKLKVYLDLSGPSLHERGYRGKTLEAPMKENLAAGLLLLAGWDKKCAEKAPFLDPFCGSGTLLVEAALIATRTAPGLFRNRFGFMSWKDHNPDLFEKVYAKLKSERVTDPALVTKLFGSDMNPAAVEIAQENLRRAGMDPFVELKTERFEDSKPPATEGLIVTNPPYGVRLDEVEALKTTYQNMGSTFKHHYKGWIVAVITSEKTLLHAVALKPSKKWALHNGGLESQFSLFDLY